MSLFKDEPEEGDAKLDPFRLTRDESAIADALSKRISVSVDKKDRCDNLVCYYAGSFDICFADGYRDALPAELHHRLSD